MIKVPWWLWKWWLVPPWWALLNVGWFMHAIAEPVPDRPTLREVWSEPFP